VFEGIDDWKADVAGWVDELGLEGALAKRSEQGLLDAFFFTSYATADGVVGVGAVGPMAAVLCEEFGVADPRALPEWSDRSQRVGLLDDARTALTAAFAALPSDQIVKRLQAHGIPVSRFRLLEEVMFDDDAEAGDLLHVWQHHQPSASTPTRSCATSGTTTPPSSASSPMASSAANPEELGRVRPTSRDRR